METVEKKQWPTFPNIYYYHTFQDHVDSMEQELVYYMSMGHMQPAAFFFCK